MSTRINQFQLSAIDDWAVNTPYLLNMEVINDGRRYRCVVEHTSSSSFDDNIENWQPELSAAISTATKEPNGFENRLLSSIALSGREFSIYPNNGWFDFWVQGKLFKKINEITITITDEEGGHFIYFNQDGTLVDDLSWGGATVAFIYWSKNQQSDIIFCDERHGIGMDWSTHALSHNAYSTMFINGLGLANLSVNSSGDLDSSTQFGIESGLIADEDIYHSIPSQLPYANLPVLYRLGVDWYKKSPDDFPVIYNGCENYSGDVAAYNPLVGGQYVLQSVGHKDFFLMHVYATNSVITPCYAVVGIESYPKITSARQGALREVAAIPTPFVESVLIASVIYQVNNDYNNVPKCRVVSTDFENGEYVDFRSILIPFVKGIISYSAGNWQRLVADNGVITWDVTRDFAAEITILSNCTLDVINLKSGIVYHLVVKQDAIGGKIITFNEKFKFQTTPQFGAETVFEFLSDGNVLWCLKNAWFQ